MNHVNRPNHFFLRTLRMVCVALALLLLSWNALAITIYVKTPAHGTRTLTADGSDTIQNIKTALQTALGTPVAQQILGYNAIYSLADNRTLADYNIQTNATLVLRNTCTPTVGYSACAMFFHTGADQTFTVPVGVTTMHVVVTGGGGGGGTTNAGGHGAQVTVSNYAVVPGSTQSIVVGGGGGAGAGGGAGGGGASSQVNAASATARVIAGGGGGGAANSPGFGTGGIGGTPIGSHGVGFGGSQCSLAGSGGCRGGGGTGGAALTNSTAGGNGNGGVGGAGSAGDYAGTGGAGGAGDSLAAGRGGNGGHSAGSSGGGGGGGGYGGGGGGDASGGGGGGSTGPAGVAYAVATNAGAATVNGGNGLVVLQWHPNPMVVTNEAELREAIFAVTNDASLAGSTISLSNNITLTKTLPMIRNSVTFEGNNYTIDADNKGRVFMVVSGTTTVNNLTVANAKAVGGAGGSASSNGGGGGGGLGAGAAVFVYSSATANLTNVTVNGASALGGAGGSGSLVATGAAGGGGGGLGGAGGNTVGQFGSGGGGGGYIGVGGSTDSAPYGGGGGGGEFGIGGSVASMFGGMGSTGDFGGGGGGGQQGNGGSSGFGSGAGGGGKTANGGNSNLSPGAGGAPEGGGGGEMSNASVAVSGAALGGGGGAGQRGGNAGSGGVAGGGGGAGGGNLAGAGGLGGGGGGGGPFISGNGGPGAAGGHFGGGGGNSATSGAIGGAGGFGGGGGGGATNVLSPSVGSAGGLGGFGAGSGGGGTGAGVAGTYAGTGGFGNTGSGGGGGAALGGAFFVAPGGTLTINGMGSGSLTGTFAVTGGAAGAGGTTAATAGQALGQYLFVGTGGNTTLNVASNETVTLGVISNPSTSSNAIAGSSATLTKSGPGTLRLYGDNQNFSGGTVAVTGGVLGGSFALGTTALSVSNGSKLTPGNASAGAMVVGALTLAANSVLEYDLGVPIGGPPGNASDFIIVTTTLPSIGANSVLNVTALSGFAAGTYSIIEYQGAGVPSAGGLTVGTMPAGYTGSISVSGTGPYNINLVVSNTFSVTYNDNGSEGGTVPTDSGSYANGATVTVLGNTGSLTRTGYTFAGWSTLANGGTDYGATFSISGNTTVYAKWTINTYTVSFNSNGGSAVSNQTVNYNAQASTPTAPTRAGYAFAGWYSDVGLNTAFNFTSAITGAITLYAKWTINSYTVTFAANGGTGSMAVQSASYNTTAALTTNAFTRIGYTFTGWNTVASGVGGTAYANGANYIFTSSITLFAQWRQFPSATTGSASSITARSVTLNGTVNDNGAITSVAFDWGRTSSYGNNGQAASVNASVAALSGSTATALTLFGLDCNTTYHFRVSATNAAGSTNGSDASFATGACDGVGPTGLLNDTGQTQCFDASNNFTTCNNASTGRSSSRPGQDGRYGRDVAALSKTGGGAAGFDFSKMCFNGQMQGAGSCTGSLIANTTASAVVASPTDWACTKDNVTNLVWSLQIGQGDWANYARSSLPAEHNAASRCGFNTGWRLPTRRELISILHLGVTGTSVPKIDLDYFPGTPAYYHWTSDPLPIPSIADGVRFVHFDWGTDGTINATGVNYNVRLVHDGM